MKRFKIGLLALLALGMMGFINMDKPKIWEEEDEYLASCAGGRCPREMVERLRKEKQQERARLKLLKGEVDDEETANESKQLFV